MNALMVVNRESGEAIAAVDAHALLVAADIVDVRVAATVELAAFADNTRQLQSVAAEARGIASNELIRRLDQDGCWTWREGGYEVKAPSPEAGTVRYHTGLLRDALQKLVADGVISPDGARSAVAPDVPTVAVPYELLRRALGALDAAMSVGALPAPAWEAVAHDINDVLADEPEAGYHQRPVGIRNLLRIPAARAAIEACRLPAEAPPRAARVRKVPT